jgi:hexosaminidase
MKQGNGKNNVVSAVLVLVMAICLLSSAGNLFLVNAAPTGGVAYWNFNEGTGTTAADSWGTNTGTLSGATWVAGKYGNGLSFNGTSNYVSVAKADIAVPWTAAMWVNRTDSTVASAALMGSTNVAIKLEQYNNTNKVGYTKFGTGDYTFNYTAPTGTWVHLAFVGTSSGVSLYVNGVFQVSNTGVINCPMTNIGCGKSGQDYLKGALDDVKIYNRALSTQEVLDLYNGVTTTPAPTNTPTPTPATTATPTPTPATTATPTPTPATTATPTPATTPTIPPIIPRPVSYTGGTGNFTLTGSTAIYVQGNNTAETDEIYKTGQYLAGKLNPSTGFSLSIVKASNPPSNSIYLTTVGGDPTLGNEGYSLNVTATAVTLSAYKPEGLFRGIQTLRQLLPADIEKSTVVTGVPWNMPCSTIRDYPSYSWRGMMLDVARHFQSITNVKRTIDLMAQYKMNKFHMHLSDDQGWRIDITSWPDLALIGGSTQVGGGAGGYYTQAQYTDIVNYAKDRYIMIIPELDMPGHCNAALASYGQLNPDGLKKALYTGTSVGFSSYMCQSEITYTFLGDVIRELAAITPGDYIHIGGDEASSTTKTDYDYFIGRVNDIVAANGKKMIGWNPVDTPSGTHSDSMLQHWSGSLSSAQAKGMKIIMSPADKAYIDMKYDSSNPIGLTWSGYNPTDDAYQWDPTNYSAQSYDAGVECPLWSETVVTMADIEYLTYPRLPGHAEVGWTPVAMRSWNEYKYRLKAHGPRMTNQGINFYHDPVVPW